jgi:hypothetical protein
LPLSLLCLLVFFPTQSKTLYVDVEQQDMAARDIGSGVCGDGFDTKGLATAGYVAIDGAVLIAAFALLYR